MRYVNGFFTVDDELFDYTRTRAYCQGQTFPERFALEGRQPPIRVRVTYAENPRRRIQFVLIHGYQADYIGDR